jgi:hypothetical protein
VPPFRWDFHGDEVRQEILRASPEAREDFRRLLNLLVRNPRSQEIGAKPLRSKPGGYTAPFDDALLVYQVFADYPRIQLLLVRWNRTAT